jgi:hypothetical protein
MKDAGGYATLGYLYQHVFKNSTAKWGTRTPFASIRRIVQDTRFFYRIKPGLWALNECKHQISNKLNGSHDSDQAFGHSYFQGLLVEIGNLSSFRTCIPSQDKNKKCVLKPLHTLTSLSQIYEFTYENVMDRARTIDVCWFNERNFPAFFFEIEHSTDFQNSLLKFIELQDFRADFRVVAPTVRRKEFATKIAQAAFRPIEKRVEFITYDQISEWHSKVSAAHVAAKEAGFVTAKL